MMCICETQCRDALFSTLALVVMLQVGCCDLQLSMRTQPKYPDRVRGWVLDSTVDRRMFQGPFVLRKGESTDNGKIGVKVFDIISARCRTHLAEFPDNAKVVLQFYDPAARQTLCEATVPENTNARIDLPDVCEGKVDITVVGVTEVNTNEKWAVFDLRP